MENKSTLNKIKALLGLEVKLAKWTLEDGTVIEAEAFEAEKEVFIVNGDERTVLPVGEYPVEDGQILVVETEGIIAEIKEADAEEEETEEVAEEETEEVEAQEEEEVPAEEEVEEDRDPVAMLAEEVAALMQRVDALEALHSEEEVPAEEVEVEASEVELSAEEDVTPITHSPEKNTETKLSFELSKNRRMTTKDRIFKQMFGK